MKQAENDSVPEAEIIKESNNGTLAHSKRYTSVSYSGRLPIPAQLKGYGDVIPGAADRIMKMAENQARHRQKTETTQVRISVAGVVFGFLIGVLAIGGGLVVINNGHDLAGSFLSISGLVDMVSVFVRGTRYRENDRTKDTDDDENLST